MNANLRVALGDEWPAFRKQLNAAIDRVSQATGRVQNAALRALIDLGLNSPAASVFQTVLSQVASVETEEELQDLLRSTRIRRKSKERSQSAESINLDSAEMRGARREFSLGASSSERIKGEVLPETFEASLSDESASGRRPLSRPRSANGGDKVTSERAAPPRVVNVIFTHTNGDPLSRSAPLIVTEQYRLRVDIGNHSTHSVLENPTTVPVDLLPPTSEGWWLKVVAVSHELELNAHRWLFLSVEGATWACSCKPESKHRCEGDQRQDHVAFDVTVPHGHKTASTRITLLFNRTIVQSMLVVADVATTHQPHGSIRGRVDYNLTNRLTDLATFEPRQLGVMMNRSENGSHTLTFDGATDVPLTIRLSDLQLRDANDMMRTALRTIHIETTGDGPNDRKNRFDAENRKNLEAFVEDLRTLATNGYRLWTTILGNQLTTWLRNRKRFLEGSGVIHVARKELSTAVFPWAVIYDYPIEPGAPHRNRLCDLLTPDNWRDFCESTGDTPKRCPHEATHRKNVICPFGFWGFRYQIELPPSVEVGRTLTRSIPSQPLPLNFVVALSEEMNEELLETHLSDLRGILKADRFTVRECRSRDAIRTGLGLDELPFAYFYCHGTTMSLTGSDAVITKLRVGNRDEILPEDLVTWRQEWGETHWQSVAPLIFINGCHTVDTSPQTLVNFVDSFSASLLAAGVVGTEITLHQSVANEAAFTFLDGFEDGLTAGQALHRSRTRLLKKGNLLGLAYTAYCVADLRLQA